MPLGQDREDDLLGPEQAHGSHRARTTAVSTSRRSGSVTDATATPWSASGVTSVLMARSRRSYVERWGRERRALHPASSHRDNGGPATLEPPMAMLTPS